MRAWRVVVVLGGERRIFTTQADSSDEARHVVRERLDLRDRRWRAAAFEVSPC
jgi:hypothetical protein